MASCNVASEDASNHDGGDWGWEPLGSEDEEPDGARSVPPSIAKPELMEESDGRQSSGMVKSTSTSSDKQLPSPTTRKVGSFSGKPIQGIVSSPSFLELEKAIGATLNLASNDSGELAEGRTAVASGNGSIPARLSSTNLTQQKVNQQRLRQQQQQHQQNQRHSNQGHRSPHSSSYASYGGNMPMAYGGPMPPPLPAPPSPSARVELSPYINESESRAIVLFHSVQVSAVDIRNACSKHGVLYYIRPEFHARGVTLISYFDLRCAISAKAGLAEDLGRHADASAHYSVMLHAANGNSEEFRLVVRHLPPDRCSEGEVQSIFERYGQLRSIQKSFNDGGIGTPRTDSSGGGPAAVEAGSGKGREEDGGGGSPSSPEATVAYTVEYYNIQDARLAASELSATSGQLWNADVTVKFAPLDERKQQLCRQLLASLSRWRTEMATAVSYSAAMQQQQQARPYLPVGIMLGQQQQQGLQMGMGHPGSAYHPAGMGMSLSMVAPPAGYGMPMQGSVFHMASADGFDGQHQQLHPSAHHMGFLGGAGMQGYAGPMDVQRLPQSPQAQDPPPMLIPAFQLSPMHSALLPGASLSNPNLFNLGLLAAQAEAQMQQQHQQQHQQAMYRQMPAVPPQQQVPLDQEAAANGGTTLVENGQRRHQGAQAEVGTAPAYYAPSTFTTLGSQQFPAVNSPRPGVPLHHQGYLQAPSPYQSHQQYYDNHNAYQSSGYGDYVSAVGQQQAPQAAPSHLQRRGRAQGHVSATSLGGAGPVHGAGGGGGHQIDADFALDMRRLDEDAETRTTIMVRNIPNKYNQQMLLEEVNAQHEGTYDFFYLPIDFKNRCNVGYCFINFLEPKYIAPFVRTFNGQRWRSFNSEKVCAVSFARIQGKQAMIARFQNSSLLEKDDEYRPLLFYSSGAERGKPEPFPVSSGATGRGRQNSRPSSASPGPLVSTSAPSPGAKPLQQLAPAATDEATGTGGSRGGSRTSPVAVEGTGTPMALRASDSFDRGKRR